MQDGSPGDWGLTGGLLPASEHRMSEEVVKPLPYVHLLDGHDAVAVLGSTLAEVERVLAGWTPQQIDRKPAPNKWSVRETLCHIADCELAWSWRFRQVLAEHHPVLQPFDQDAWSAAYTGVGYTAAAALATWHRLRLWNLALLEPLDAEALDRKGHNPEQGDVKLRQLIEIAAGHDLHHRTSLARLTMAE